MKRYCIVKYSDYGYDNREYNYEYTYAKTYDNYDDAKKFLSKLNDYLSKREDKVDYYGQQYAKGDLVYFDKDRVEITDYYDLTLWKIETFITSDETSSDESVIFKKLIKEYIDWCKLWNIDMSDSELHELFATFMFKWADLKFDQKKLSEDDDLVARFFDVTDTGSLWVKAADKDEKIHDEIWKTLFRMIFHVVDKEN